MEQNQKKRSTFPERWDSCCQRRARQSGWAIYGDFHIWRRNTAAVYSLLIYIALALTFGYTMITAETAIGRMTQKSPVGAYKKFGKSKWLSFGGWINAVIPILIVPYLFCYRRLGNKVSG